MRSRVDRLTRVGLWGVVAGGAGSLLACSLIVGGDLTGGTPTNTFGEDASSGAADAAALDGNVASESEAGGASYVSAIMDDAPAAYWRLGEKPGANSAKSEIGSMACALNGPMTWGTPGAIARDANTALALDGNGALDCGDRFDFAGTQPYTLEVWLRAETIDTTYRFVFTKREEASAGTAAYAMWLHAPEGLGFERLFDGNSKVAYMPFTTGTAFHHVVGVYSGTELRLYLDGEFVINAPDARSSPTISASLSVGALSSGTSSGVVGVLDEAAIYEKALSPERIRAHYQAGR